MFYPFFFEHFTKHDSMAAVFKAVLSNQIFHYTYCITPNRVTSLQSPSPRYCARSTQLLLKKCPSGGDPLATLCRFDRPEI